MPFYEHLFVILKTWLTPKVLVVITLSSVGLAVASIALMPYILCKLPTDYFNQEKPHLLTRIRQSSPLKSCALIAKNMVGLALLLAGILMLFLPGQGLLTILIGLVLMDFPGKYRLERRVIGGAKVLAAVNWLRARKGAAPMNIIRD